MSQTALMDFESMRNVDIRTVDPNILADIRDIEVDMDMPSSERILNYIQQISNPYCFRCGKMTVKISHANTEVTMEERMEGFFRSL